MKEDFNFGKTKIRKNLNIRFVLINGKYFFNDSLQLKIFKLILKNPLSSKSSAIFHINAF